ncbi:MAG: hypothetical protein V4454_01310 [Pseudomonadota bacterium]
MLKIRYYRLRLPPGIGINSVESSAYKLASSSGISVLRAAADELIVRYTSTRHIETIQILSDGSEVKTSIPTMEQYSLRFFQTNTDVLLSLLDPPRGLRITSEVLGLLLGQGNYFIETLEISSALIKRHIEIFDSVKLVSAKIRDFKVYENAIGRLEIGSKDGLSDEIAPFLAGKYYKTDSLTYEVTHQFQRGLICYSSNGTVRVSGPLVEIAFPTFELQIMHQ